MSPSAFPAGARPPTPILDTINFPVHMKNLSIKQLEQLAEEIRKDVIYTVSKVRRGGGAQAKRGMRRASQDCMWRHAAAGAARQRLLCLREQV